MSKLAFLVPLFPLIGFLLNGLGRKSLAKSSSGTIACLSVLASFVVSILLFLQVRNGQTGSVELFDFISFGKLHIPFAFQVDQLTVLFLLVITGIGFLIHLYSTSYMNDESPADFARYFSYLNLFVFSMLLLVMGANFVILFIGWEGVGLCSYLLIGYWFRNTDYTAAAKKAFVMNRIGDLGFLLGIFWMIQQFNSTTFSEIFPQIATMKPNDGALIGISLLLFIGATGKSAQIPLYTWLPDAMAGPTPVSALIHAATMVTAGIYMIVRSNILYTLAPFTQTIVAVTGLATAILAATIALKQNDIKKVLAYSTVSQLGYMFLGLGVGAYTGSVFHVMTHAFFKALLFLGAGSVIHALHGQQDVRGMGGLKKYLPVTHITFLIACFAIAGIFPFSGFFSKDEILAASFAENPAYYIFGAGGALLTTFYMFRLYSLTFQGKFRGTEEERKHLHESPFAITIPLILLALLSFAGGLINVPEILGGSASLAAFLAPVLAASTQLQHAHAIDHNTEYGLMFGLMGLSLIVIVVAWRQFSGRKADALQVSAEEPKGLFANKWYVDEIYESVVSRPLKGLSLFFNRVVERLAIDGIVNGVGRLVNYGSRQLRLLQNGQVGGYILMMVVATLAFFIIQLFLQ